MTVLNFRNKGFKFVVIYMDSKNPNQAHQRQASCILYEIMTSVKCSNDMML